MRHTEPVNDKAKKTKRPSLETGVKLRGADKLERIPVKIIPTHRERLPKKPPWLRVKAPTSPRVHALKNLLRKHKLHTVCEEAACPNLGECFHKGTATFMIMGDICTRRCAFCDVAHGRPNPLNTEEPEHLAAAIAEMALDYVVITSVDRDDLRDGGAGHFAACIKAARARCPNLTIEILTPDFRGRMDKALDILSLTTPDIFNHNIETVPRLYRAARPGSDFQWSLTLLKEYKTKNPAVPTKSGLMLGLGETNEEIIEVLQNLRAHDIDMVTLGQYLQPSRNHMAVKRFVTPEEFNELGRVAKELGFSKVASGALVRSSYHAEEQIKGDMF